MTGGGGGVVWMRKCIMTITSYMVIVIDIMIMEFNIMKRFTDMVKRWEHGSIGIQLVTYNK